MTFFCKESVSFANLPKFWHSYWLGSENFDFQALPGLNWAENQINQNSRYGCQINANFMEILKNAQNLPQGFINFHKIWFRRAASRKFLRKCENHLIFALKCKNCRLQRCYEAGMSSESKFFENLSENLKKFQISSFAGTSLARREQFRNWKFLR